MKNAMLCLSLFISQITLATTFTTYGNTTYGSDGSSFTTYGNTTYSNYGTSYNTYGNITYGSDGSSFATYGNTTYANDGTTYTTYGNTTYGSDGSTATQYGNTIYVTPGYTAPSYNTANQYGNTIYVTPGYTAPSYNTANAIKPVYYSDVPSRQLMDTGHAISEWSDAILQRGIEESRSNSTNAYNNYWAGSYSTEEYKVPNTQWVDYDAVYNKPQEKKTQEKKDDTRWPISGTPTDADTKSCIKIGGTEYCD